MTNIDYTNNLRLEVEVPVAGLPNLIENHSGDKGAFGWITPVANTLMYSDTLVGGSPTLRFRNNTSGAGHFTSDFLLLAAGKYVSARYDIPVSTNAYNKGRFEFYNSSKVLISSSAQSALQNVVGTHYLPTTVAPAGTVYVKVRFDQYSNTGAALGFAHNAYFKTVMVTVQDTGTVSTKRTNMCINPSFETNLTGWFTETNNGGADATNQRIAAPAGATGSWVYRVANPYATDGLLAYYNWTAPVTGGQTYSFRARTQAQNEARPVWWHIFWYDSRFNEVGRSESAKVDGILGGWKDVTYTATAPSNAVHMMPAIRFGSVQKNHGHLIDGVLFEQSSTVKPFFAGSFTETASHVYAWTGTAHASTSTETTKANTFDFSEPRDWRNILGPTHEIKINRGGLDVGLMSATVMDAMLDPSVSDVIRPGKRVRLQAWHKDKNLFDSVYEGILTAATVSYNKEKVFNAKVETRIEVTASDAVSTLANQGESRGVADIASLPWILEGKGVPWSVNGSGNQVSTGTIVSYNENASVLDQVAVTRDSNLGFAYVSRDGVLNVDSTNTAALSYDFSDDIVAVEDTSTNLVLNPSFEVDTTEWVSGAGYTITAVTDDGATAGAKVGNVTATANQINNNSWAMTALMPTGSETTVSAGVTAKRRNTSAPATVRLLILCYDAAGAFLGTGGSNVTVDTINGVEGKVEGVTFLAGTIQFRIGLYPAVYSAGASTNWLTGGRIDIDRIHANFGSTLDPYFDGDSAGAVWNGTPHRSTSTLGEGSVSGYTDIDVSFSTEECINTVQVDWLRYNIGTGTTQEIPYGPYLDATSIAKWGARSATFKVHGQTESASDIAAYAASILAANANPVVKVNDLEFVVNDLNDLRHAIDAELMHVTKVVWQGKTYTPRIYGIEHTITPQEWTVGLTFTTEGSVAAPTWTPSPPFQGVSAKSIEYGIASHATDANGYFMVPHTLGVKPSAVIGTPASHYGNATIFLWDNVGTTASHIRFLAKDHANTALANQSRSVSWAAFV